MLPVSWLYGRAALFSRQLRTSHARRLACPVLSVGNITCGGTGKTPTVEMAIRDLISRGRHPAILSRGYGVRVDPRARAHSIAERTEGLGATGTGWNDEYLVLRQNLPDTPHYQGKDRYRGGLAALAQGADVLVLDDGFQHVRLHRDIDFVLIDATLPFGYGRILPSGLLREPLEVLERADLLGITRSDQVHSLTLGTLVSYLRRRFPRVPRVILRSEPVDWVRLGGGSEPPETLRRRRVLAFSGVGNPRSFHRQLLALDVDMRDFLCFRDHHAYTEADLRAIERRAERCGAEDVVMTQKDAVKICGAGDRARWRFLRIEQRIASGQDEYAAILDRLLSCH